MPSLALYWIFLASITLQGTWSHPFDPLTPAEIQQCSQLVQRTQQTSTGFNFIWITLIEPEKQNFFPLLDRPAEWSRIPRKCLLIIIERGTGRVFEGEINLNLKRFERWEQLPPGTTPLYAPDELMAAVSIFRNDSAVRERCARLGYRNMESVAAEPWAIGYIDDRPEWLGRRLLQVFPYGLNSPNDNSFAHPFDFIGIVDVIQERVIGIEDLPVHHQFSVRNRNAGVTIPRREANYDQGFSRGNFSQSEQPGRGGQRGAHYTRPAEPTHRQRPAPQGQGYGRAHGQQPYRGQQQPRFVPVYQNSPPVFGRFKRQSQRQRNSPVFVEGNELRWENFQLRLGFNGREGLVLHDIRYRDGATVRPLIYRASIVEMLVPYADPRPPYHRKAVYDTGEYGMGFWANSLQPGVDCRPDAVFIHGTLNDLRGNAVTRQNVICAYEEELGILFKHTNLGTRRVTHARNRRLVISTVSTVGNYDYGMYWIFGLDASIQFTVKATGLLDTELLAEGEDTYGYGIQIFPQINTQFHQHFFAARLDPMLDGALNSVAVVDVVPEKTATGSKENPYGQGFATERRVLDTVANACTRIDPFKSRTWEIFGSGIQPNVKEPKGWRFIPMNNGQILMKRDSPLFSKAGFTNYDVWVTLYNDKEIYPGGFYLNGRSGLPEILKRNPHGKIEQKDVVFWHIFGLTHIPRAEDFPIMPIEETGFIFRPHNFFLENPALRHAVTTTPPRNQ